MRDILDTLDMVQEGVGLARRKPGETFKNPQGDELVFQGLDFYPNQGKFASAEDMQLQIDNLSSTLPRPIAWVNQPKPIHQAFGIARFQALDGQEYYLGKYFDNIRANRNDNNFAHSDIPGGFKYNSQQGAKENAGYKPYQVLTTQLKGNTPDSIISQIIQHFGAESDEGIAAQIFANSADFPISVPKGNMDFNAFRVYFMEMLQPAAIVRGMPVSGNLQECVDIFFGAGGTVTDCLINFNDTQGGALSDSELVNPQGKSLKISTKDAVGGGVKASAQNLINAFQELQDTPQGAKLAKKHKEIIPVLTALRGNAHYSGPLKIAENYGLITSKEVEQIMNLKNLRLDLGANPIGQKILSAKLEKMYQAYRDNWKKPVVPIHTMMLIIAYRVARYVNDNTNFSSAAADILNHSALVQVESLVEQRGENFVIKGMSAHWPSTAVSSVTLSTEKAYWTTGAQGNMTFKINYNGETSPEEAEPSAPAAPAGEPSVEFTPARSNIKAAATKETPLGTKKTLGRERRKS